MRVVHELSYPECKITFFSWNNRYLIKFEQGLLEQTFKIDQFDVKDVEELVKLIDTEFLKLAVSRFQEMSQSLMEARHRLAQQ